VIADLELGSYITITGTVEEIDSQTSNLFLSDACVPIQEIVRMESEAFDRICTEVNVYAGSD
jgi:hypothetical protein